MSQVRLDEASLDKGYESRDIWIRKVIFGVRYRLHSKVNNEA
jgi:hypothetical protein